MRKESLSFSPPLIGEEEIAEVIDTLRSDWITTGPKTKLFDDWIGCQRCHAVPVALGERPVRMADSVSDLKCIQHLRWSWNQRIESVQAHAGYADSRAAQSVRIDEPGVIRR